MYARARLCSVVCNCITIDYPFGWLLFDLDGYKVRLILAFVAVAYETNIAAPRHAVIIVTFERIRISYR